MKLRIRLSLLLFAAICLAGLMQSCSSCSNKEHQSKPFNETQFEANLTREDTVKVKEKIDKYFNYLIQGNYSEAAAMLYHVNKSGDQSEKPIEYSNEEMQNFITAMSSLPIESYNIEYMKFSESTSNEVMCRVTLKKFAENAPAMTSKVCFKPIFYLGTWLLTLANSETGDAAIVHGQDRDSLKRKYFNYNQNLKNEGKQ